MFIIVSLVILAVDGWLVYNIRETMAEEQEFDELIEIVEADIANLEEELASAEQTVTAQLEQAAAEQAAAEQAAAEQAAAEQAAAEQAAAEQAAAEQAAIEAAEGAEIEANEAGIHMYEYCIMDCTWEEAYYLALEVGGNLVHINSIEEYEYILEEIYAYGYEEYQFMIGGRRTENDTNYYWVNTEEELYGTPLNGIDYWATQVGAWYPGEPSYMDGDIVEDCMNFYFNEELGSWVWNDVPNDILAVAPNFSGKIGFIIEYDN